MFKKIRIILRTLSYLKLIQLIFQIKYRLNIPSFFFKSINLKSKGKKIFFFDYLETSSFTTKPYQFEFLNKTVIFKNQIDWNYNKNGKLWNYNLNYLDFISKRDLDLEVVQEIIESYYHNYTTIVDGREPYPTSLRIMNLVKTKVYYNSEKLNFILKKDIERLIQSFEYHLMGNHLLENAFALYFAAHVYPTEIRLVDKSIKVLKEQLTEQIMADGSHFERSFMYHQILLGRVLDSISLSENNPHNWNISMIKMLRNTAEKMLSWLNEVSDNGKIFIRFNDSIEGVAPSSYQLFEFASRLNIRFSTDHKLSDSLFRIIKKKHYLCTLNIGEITPSYQPGHSHAETFNFCIFSNNEPIIVSPGITTYENLKRREIERSSKMHNTLSIGNYDNNEVWNLFRVGRRAKVRIHEDSPNQIIASHNGYRNLNIEHQRQWIFEENRMVIMDRILNHPISDSFVNFHFFPDTIIQQTGDLSFNINNVFKILFETDNTQLYIKIDQYRYSLGFNNSVFATKLIIPIETRLKTTFIFHNGLEI